MAEYLAPGTYIEEVSFRSRSIEGESTTVTGFIGPARYGPIDLENDLLTSIGDFEVEFGDHDQLEFDDGFHHNYLWHAARAFFTEGGKQLYVSRIFNRLDSTDAEAPPGGTLDATPVVDGGLYKDGYARWTAADSSPPAEQSLKIRARWPGAYGNQRVRFTLRLGQNVLAFDKALVNGSLVDVPRVSSIVDRDVVLITHNSASPPVTNFYLATFDRASQSLKFTRPNGQELDLTGTGSNSFVRGVGDQVQLVNVKVTVMPHSAGAVQVFDNLALDPDHETNGAQDGVTFVFDSHEENPQRERQHGRDKPIVITAGSQLTDGLSILDALFAASPDQSSSPPSPAAASILEQALLDPKKSDADRFVDFLLEGGNDGRLPGATEYEGNADPSSTTKTGLKQFEDLESLSIIAAPGSTFNYTGDPDRADTIVNLVIAHCALMRFRIAVIDSGNSLSITQVQDMRARFDSSYAAFYYPWVRVLDPVTRVPIFLPPSGFVAGIYARNDLNRAVYKAPANEVVNLSIGFERLLNKAQQDVLNPPGINCFRYFEGRGYLLWGARTMSSDPEWKYVNIRRYFAYLEHSIDHGTQWAVFEPNGPHLWSNVRQTIADFLLNEFFTGAMVGDKPETSYFVRCDRSTMTQNDLDNGRLVVLIGVAAVKPAEFVIFRIGQWTADAH
ncbi:MAG TPA: phage tail sheath subtilisin-like domain-containing protein [Myxococcales bacterium]|jgi:hypothetical protein